MPGTVNHTHVVAGFYGKLPSRGDFVRVGLPRDFTEKWDAWMQTSIAGSRVLMGDDWLPRYLEAPIWRFLLPVGVCGTQAALGLVMPSVDKVGRYFPLAFAALTEGGAFDEDDPWLARAEDAGFAALENDADPDQMTSLLGEPPGVAWAGEPRSTSVWWTEGSPRLGARRLILADLPDIPTYAAMLGAESEVPATQDVSWEVPI